MSRQRQTSPSCRGRLPTPFTQILPEARRFTFPLDVWSDISRLLGFRDLAVLSQTCRGLHGLATTQLLRHEIVLSDDNNLRSFLLFLDADLGFRGPRVKKISIISEDKTGEGSPLIDQSLVIEVIGRCQQISSLKWSEKSDPAIDDRLLTALRKLPGLELVCKLVVSKNSDLPRLLEDASCPLKWLCIQFDPQRPPEDRDPASCLEVFRSTLVALMVLNPEIRLHHRVRYEKLTRLLLRGCMALEIRPLLHCFPNLQCLDVCGRLESRRPAFERRRANNALAWNQRGQLWRNLSLVVASAGLFHSLAIAVPWWFVSSPPAASSTGNLKLLGTVIKASGFERLILRLTMHDWRQIPTLARTLANPKIRHLSVYIGLVQCNTAHCTAEAYDVNELQVSH